MNNTGDSIESIPLCTPCLLVMFHWHQETNLAICKTLGSDHTEVLALAMPKKLVEYLFLAMSADTNAIAKNSVWTESYLHVNPSSLDNYAG